MLRRNVIRSPDQYNKLQTNIIKYSHLLPNISNISFDNPFVHSFSWFRNLQYTFPSTYTQLPIDLSKAEKKNIEYRTRKIKMFPDILQSYILDYWFNAFNIMYNHTIIFLRKHLPYTIIINYKNYYYQHLIYFQLSKSIKDKISEINKLTIKKDGLIINLNNLLQFQDKNKQLFKKIDAARFNIKVIKENIKSINKNIDQLLIQRKPLTQFEKLYQFWDKHINYYLNYQNIRTNHLKSRRDEIANFHSKFNNDPNNKIHAHSLDGKMVLYKT